MRIALPTWQGRIAPVFDVAGHLLLVDVEDGRETRREEKPLPKAEFSARAADLVRYRVNVLICGAISAPLQLKLIASGLKVIGFICGTVDDVLTAYLNGTLANRAFAMPGCQRWRWHGGQDVLPAGFGMGRGRGVGRRCGRTRKAGGSDPVLAASEDFLVCPKCSEIVQRTSGQKGIESLRSKCPRCGASVPPF